MGAAKLTGLVHLPWSQMLRNQASKEPGRVEAEMDRRPHLASDLRHERREAKARVIDARRQEMAADAIGQRLPYSSESVHVAISGKFALWDFIPATLAIAGVGLEAVTIATLGFSRRNIAAMCGMVDAGQIGSVRLLCSHYFSQTSKQLYDFASEEFSKRGQMQFLSLRTHAKVVLMALSDGRRVSIESSANLRSCQNIEQATLFGDPAVYDFHFGWIEGLFVASRNGPQQVRESGKTTTH